MAIPTVHDWTEHKLIGRIARRMQGLRSSSVRVGIGDDAAVLECPRGFLLLFASDMFVEGVHFHRRLLPAVWIGWKALAANLSDIAAMGGLPCWAVVSLGLPQTIPVPFVDGLYRGLKRCGRRFGVPIVGGDTVRSPQVVIDVAVVGKVRAEHLCLRTGARVGDVLCVTGRLGGSYPSGRHARFIPRLREAQQLLRRIPIHAMMDLSDGLASDLWQMSRASHRILRIDADRVPQSAGVKTLNQALTDGEDFELLFAVSSQDAARLPHRVGRCPITGIGSVVRSGVGVELRKADGRVHPLQPGGFRHF